MSFQLIFPPISILLSFYFAVDQLISLSLNLWRSPASHSLWVFPLLSTTSMATTRSHRDRGTSFATKLRKNDLLHCKMNIFLILHCEFFYIFIFIFFFFLGQLESVYILEVKTKKNKKKKKLKIHYKFFLSSGWTPCHQHSAARDHFIELNAKETCFYARMHGRGSRGAAPASDAVRHGDAGGTPLTVRRCRVCHVVSFFFCRRGWDSARFALIYADSGHIGRNRRNGWFKPKRPIQVEIQTLSLTPSLISLLCALCGVRVLGFLESLSASLSLLSVSASPQQPNTNATFLPGLPGWLEASQKKKKKNATLLARELQYKNIWLPQNALCFVFYWTP